jgi:hypothetical protein
MGLQDKMKTKQEHIGERRRERGNALIYVLIAIALFAALSMTFGRSTDTSEISDLSDEKAQIIATQMISYSGQVKAALDQMQFSNTKIADFDFTPSNSPAFETEPPPNINKVYHPSGGGIVAGSIPPEAIIPSPGNDPDPGWYMGRINNVDWTKLGPGNPTGLPFEDVILVAYQIKPVVCEKINKILSGSATIPVITDTIPNVMIDDAYHGGTNLPEFTTDSGEICPACHGVASLCVEDSSGEYGFYSIVADQ